MDRRFLRAAKKEGCDPKEWPAMPPLRGLSNEGAGKIINVINAFIISRRFPSCGTANSPAQKFCGECGISLAQSVPAEKFASPESYTPKHLAEKILTSKGALEGERKQVTVLFCDIANSTPTAERGSVPRGCTAYSTASSSWRWPRSTGTRARSISFWAMASWRCSALRSATRTTRAGRS
jgi:hypothetical protein